MAVRASQYARDLERNISKGKTLSQAHKRASSTSSTTRKVDKYDKPSMSDRVLYKVGQIQTAYRKLRRKRRKK